MLHFFYVFGHIFDIYQETQMVCFKKKYIFARHFKTETMQFNKVLAVFCFGILFVCNACQRETKDEKFKRDFQLFTQKECPKFVDPCTRLDSACYDIASRTLSYHYTVQDILDDEAIYTEELNSAHYDDILKGLKNSIQMKPYKDEGINFRYDYRSITTGKMLLELDFTPEDYKN